MRLILSFWVALSLMPMPAHALCRDDLRDLKPRIESIKSSHKDRYTAAIRWWDLANKVEPTSELECDTYYHRAYRALLHGDTATNGGGTAASSRR